MCKGTSCTHDTDPAVRFVEEPYDSWEYKRWPVYEYDPRESEPWAVVIRVIGRSGYMSNNSLSGGPSHDQAMIRVKDDVGRWSEYDEEGFAKAMFCNACDTHGHFCNNCDKKIPHMAVGECIDCYDRIEIASIRERFTSDV